MNINKEMVERMIKDLGENTVVKLSKGLSEINIYEDLEKVRENATVEELKDKVHEITEYCEKILPKAEDTVAGGNINKMRLQVLSMTTVTGLELEYSDSDMYESMYASITDTVNWAKFKIGLIDYDDPMAYKCVNGWVDYINERHPVIHKPKNYVDTNAVLAEIMDNLKGGVAQMKHAHKIFRQTLDELLNAGNEQTERIAQTASELDYDNACKYVNAHIDSRWYNKQFKELSGKFDKKKADVVKQYLKSSAVFVLKELGNAGCWVETRVERR